MQKYNFAFCIVWVRNLVAHTEKGRRLRVFKNRVLSITFGPNRDEVTGEWRKLHNKELNDLYFSPSIIWVIKSRRMRRAKEGRGMYHEWGEERYIQGFWWENLRERDHWVDPGVDGSIILRCIIRKWEVGVWTGSSWLRIGTGCRKWQMRYCTVPSSCIKCGEFE
jgi:hypothetical protein